MPPNINYQLKQYHKMRILLILLSLAYIFPLNSVGQEIVRFKKRQMKESVCLYSIEDEKFREKILKISGITEKRG